MGAPGARRGPRAGDYHRDVKPQNLLVRASDGLVKLTDFGVARAIRGRAGHGGGHDLRDRALHGPEQSAGGAIGPATDVYAVGVVLFDALTGRLPFEGDTPLQDRAPTPARAAARRDRSRSPAATGLASRSSNARSRRTRWRASRAPRRCGRRSMRPWPTSRDSGQLPQQPRLYPCLPYRRGERHSPLSGKRRQYSARPTARCKPTGSQGRDGRRGGLGCVLPLLGCSSCSLTAVLVVLARDFGSAPRPEATAVSGVLPEPTGAAVALASPTATATPPPPTPTPRAPTAVPTEVPAPVVVPPTATHVPPTATPLPPTPKPPAPTQPPAPKPAPTATPTTPAQGNGFWRATTER